jgi:hypothetical protein
MRSSKQAAGKSLRGKTLESGGSLANVPVDYRFERLFEIEMSTFILFVF